MACVTNFRLGQRVYIVADGGEIEVDLISVIKFADKKDDDIFRTNLFGHMNPVLWWSYGTLRGCKDCIVSFEDAVSKAITVIDEQLSSEEISVEDHKKLSDYKTRIENSPQKVKEELDGVKRFTERKFILKDVDGEEKTFTQEDFPTHYIPVGTTPVYIANVADWTIIKGPVTKVSFDANRPRKHLYHVGSHANQSAKTVFRTKKGAVNYLRKMFMQSGIPATFDPKKVKVVKYTSEADREQSIRERFSRRRASLKLSGL